VYLLQQIVEIRSLIQRVHDVGKHHALSFQPRELGDVLIAQQNAADIRIMTLINGNHIKPPPLAGFRA